MAGGSIGLYDSSFTIVDNRNPAWLPTDLIHQKNSSIVHI